MRAIKVSMSPSTRSRLAICPATHAMGSRSSGPARWRKQWASSRVWLSLMTFENRGSGTPPKATELHLDEWPVRQHPSSARGLATRGGRRLRGLDETRYGGRSSRLFNNAAIDPNLSRLLRQFDELAAQSYAFRSLRRFPRRGYPARRWCRRYRHSCAARRDRRSEQSRQRSAAAGRARRTYRFGRRRHGLDPCRDPCRWHQSDEIVDLAGLEHPDLRVARSRLSAPRTTAMPPSCRRISSARENTSAMAKATTALRGGSRVTFL